MADISDIKREYQDLLLQLSDPELISDWEKFERLTKKKNHLEKIFQKEEEIAEIKNRLAENQSIISAKEDSELISLAESENIQLQEKEKILEKQLENLLNNEESKSQQSNTSPNSAIIEIRAGTGGEEAALFCADLFRMYSKYAETKNWKKIVLNCHYSDLGGIKEVIFELKDGDVFSEMQYEAGVHRVQRIPITEKSGRIHTSTVSVAVLARPKKGKISINPNDLKITTYKASGPGGQYVNKRMTAVRVLHLPTGITVTSQTERNLQENRENALSILEAKLLEQKEIQEQEKILNQRRSQIGKAQRAEKIRTYNFPQNRVTDHRLKKSWHNLDRILEGELDKIIEALKKEKEKN